MILTWFIIILITGGILAKIAEYWNPWIPKWIALIVSLIALSVAASLWISNYAVLQTSHSAWLITYILPWIPQFGISFHLAMDGLSLLMLMLTYFLGTLAVLTSWKE
ncbi:MAG TPA: hypothetical protein VL443_15555, partial [Cyclobacteriaceae bacterium]|nr:hypothetical protein [Cyclobacteriaceae bacterium]